MFTILIDRRLIAIKLFVNSARSMRIVRKWMHAAARRCCDAFLLRLVPSNLLEADWKAASVLKSFLYTDDVLRMVNMLNTESDSHLATFESYRHIVLKIT